MRDHRGRFVPNELRRILRRMIRNRDRELALIQNLVDAQERYERRLRELEGEA